MTAERVRPQGRTRRVRLALVVLAWVVMLYANAMTFFPVAAIIAMSPVWQLGFIVVAAGLVPAAALGVVAVVLAHRSLWLGRPGTGTTALIIAGAVGAVVLGSLTEGIVFQP